MMPFFTFFGGKWRAAPHYPKPEYDFIVEPFAGSAGYSIRYYQRQIILIEKDPIIANLWTWLTRVSGDEIASLPLDVKDVRELDLCQPAKSLIGFWLNKGMTSPCNIPSKWMREGWRPKSVWCDEIRERIATQVELIRHWDVIQGDYWEITNESATWFIDPPYQISGLRYRFSSKHIDFERLASFCTTRLGQTIVCEQEGATWLPFEPFRETKALEGKRGIKRSKEVIYKKED